MDNNRTLKLREMLRKYTQRSTVLALVLFGVDVLLYVTMIAGTLVFDSFYLKLACSISAGLMISSIFVIGHDAAHYSYTDSKRLNIIIGYLALLPALHNYSLWRIAHSRFHHVHTNQKGMNSWSPISKKEYDLLPRWKQFIERFYRTPLGVGVYYMVERWWKYKFFPTGRSVQDMEGNYRRDFSFVLLYAVLYAGLIGYLGSIIVGSTALSGIMFGFVVPFVVWNYAMGLTVYMQHTNPNTPWFDNLEQADSINGQEEVTVYVKLPGWYGYISHNIMEHTAHHVLPTVPLYQLKDAQKELEQFLGDSMIKEKFTLSYLFHIMAACKLYDYENHQWQNYKGEYTTECTLPDRLREGEMHIKKTEGCYVKYA